MSGIHMALLGAAGDRVRVTDQAIQALSSTTATAVYRVASDGKVYSVVNGGAARELEQWCTPTTSAGNYEARATVTAGALTSGTTGSWVALTSTRDWTLQETVSGTAALCTFTIELRPIGGATIASATIYLGATVF